MNPIFFGYHFCQEDQYSSMDGIQQQPYSYLFTSVFPQDALYCCLPFLHPLGYREEGMLYSP